MKETCEDQSSPKRPTCRSRQATIARFSFLLPSLLTTPQAHPTHIVTTHSQNGTRDGITHSRVIDRQHLPTTRLTRPRNATSADFTPASSRILQEDLLGLAHRNAHPDSSIDPFLDFASPGSRRASIFLTPHHYPNRQFHPRLPTMPLRFPIAASSSVYPWSLRASHMLGSSSKVPALLCVTGFHGPYVRDRGLG
jgi:hypothetical protein